MENLRERMTRLFNESKNEIEVIGINLNKNITCSISNCKGRLGVCKSKKRIEISNYMFNFDDNTIKNTIIHELLHTLNDTNGHDSKWKWYANKVNKEYKNYNITRLANLKEICNNHDFKIDEVIPYKYKIICIDCGRVLYRNRLSDWQKKYIKSNYKCKCGGKNDLK